jgi:hypothetical protein
LYLEDGLNKEAFRVAVIAAKRKDLADNAAAWLTFNMDDKIDSFCDLGFGMAKCFARDCASRDWRNGEGLSPPSWRGS